jgi:hypothetical protein
MEKVPEEGKREKGGNRGDEKRWTLSVQRNIL